MSDNKVFQQEEFSATWGPLLNLTNGNIVLDDETITLQPSVAKTVMSGGIGRSAYTSQVYKIADVCGYVNKFAAWMEIMFADGTRLKLSYSISKNSKRKLIEAIERRRAHYYESRGENIPQLKSNI